MGREEGDVRLREVYWRLREEKRDKERVSR